VGDPVALAVTVLSSGALGYVTGWALKKLIGVIEVVAAMAFLFLGGLSALGIVTVNVGAALYWLGWLAEKIWGAADWGSILAAGGIWTGSFLAGLIIGLAKAPQSVRGGGCPWLEP
jgi:uncharacterized membrane protein (Fun14 family)